MTGFVFRDNLIRHNAFGVIGSDRGIGTSTLDAFFPDAVFASNTIAGGVSNRYPKGNTFINEDEFDGVFNDGRGGDYRLKPTSRARAAGSDGKDVGADIGAIAQVLGTRPR